MVKKYNMLNLFYLIFALVTSIDVWAKSNDIYVVDIVPESAADYTLDLQQEEVSKSTELAIHDYKKFNSRCKPKVVKLIRHGTENDLYQTVKEISEKAAVLVGVSRTNSARIAAKAAAGSSLVAISIGAATTRLRDLNKNFVSIASPWTHQWAKIEEELHANHCTPNTTLGVFDSTQWLSNSFKETFEKDRLGTSLDHPSTTFMSEKAKAAKCIALGLYVASAEAYLREIIVEKWTGVIIGTSDWNYFPREIKTQLSLLRGAGVKFFLPTGWTPKQKGKSREFSNQMNELIDRVPSPVAAYSYDSMLLALDYVCAQFNPTIFNSPRLAKLHLLRNYSALAESGNYISPMETVEFGK